MSPLREKAYAEIDSLSDEQLGVVLKEIYRVKESKEQAEEREIIRLKAKKAFEDIRAECQNCPELTLDEINDEIRLAREERRMRIQNVCCD